MEYEVDAVQVLTKRLKIRSVNGDLVAAFMQVYESEDPYMLIILITTEFDNELRLDVHKDQLAAELRRWLEGENLRYPAVVIPQRIEVAISKFVKMGQTPLQEDLIMWLLSRCEYHASHFQELVLGCADVREDYAFYGPGNLQVNNEYDNNVRAFTESSAYRDDESRALDSMHSSKKKGASKVPGTVTVSQLDQEDLGTFRATQQLMGKSLTLETLKKMRTKSKGRAGSKAVLSMNNWSAEHWRVAEDIVKARQTIEADMDARRRLVEIAKIRKLQAAEKYGRIREEIVEKTQGNKFTRMANYELNTLQRIDADVRDDMIRQKSRAHRESQQLVWTMAPNGSGNRRGQSKKGPVIGQGPLPPNATSKMKDPRVEHTVQRFYWDSQGRRHVKNYDELEQSSAVEQAMELIRRAASNASAYKLDFKAVFQQFDTSGDGYLSPVELVNALLSFGVELDTASMEALLKHFDPNGSGSVHYGEFVWAFFNRRKLVRQWRRKTEAMTESQIRERFHAADKNGDGQLNPKEFKRMLQSFDMQLDDQAVQLLIDRFDVDGDGDIDLNEFRTFIEAEVARLQGSTLSDSLSPTRLNTGGASTQRPVSAPRMRVKGGYDLGSSRTATADAVTQVVDPAWAQRMLEAQATIEQRLGRTYFN